MAGARLRRFDVTLWRNTSIEDDRQVPLVGGTIDFYRQGATVRTVTAPIDGIAPGTAAEVDVYDVGAVKALDAVLAGPGGPVLVVEPNGVLSPTRVLLKNSGTSPVRLVDGMRLIPTGARPIAYKDPFGTSVIGSALATDGHGRAVGYIRESRYDYVHTRSRPARFDAASSTAKTWSDATMSWFHTASGSERLVLVGIAWQDSQGVETLDQVTYGGIKMSLLSSSQYLATFWLRNPPVGLQEIVATWSGVGHKGAIGGAVSFDGTHQAAPPSSAAQDTSAAPYAEVSNVDDLAMLFGAVGVNAAASAPALTTDPGQDERWSGSAGDVQMVDLTLGTGLTVANTGGPSATVGVAWTLSAARAWGAVCVEVRPAPVLRIDTGGAVLVSAPAWLNVRDFQSLTAAVEALPNPVGGEGGEMFLPEGEYLLPKVLPEDPDESPYGLLIDKPHVTLRGVGPKTIIKAAVQNPDYDLIKVTRERVQFRDLVLDGNADEARTDIGACLRLEWPFLELPPPPHPQKQVCQHYLLDNVLMTRGGMAGLRVIDSLLILAMNCRFNGNFGPGALLEFGRSKGLTNLRFMGCEFAANANRGVWGRELAGALPFGQSFSFLGCRFVENLELPFEDELKGNGIWLNSVKSVQMRGCSFKYSQSMANYRQFVWVEATDTALIEACLFEITGQSIGTTRCAYFVNSPGSRFSDNVAIGDFERMVEFHEDSKVGLEFANHRVGGNLSVEALASSLLLSQGALSLNRYSLATRPEAASLPVGSLVWVNNPGDGLSYLQIVAMQAGAKTWKRLNLLTI